jgi:hypothetical protein
MDEDGDVFCTYDGRPVTDSRQILAEQSYFVEVRDGGPGLIHDDGEQAYYALTGELVVSRNRVDVRHLLGPTRGTTDKAG